MHGKVIDRFGAPVRNVTVQVGEVQVFTNDSGNFTVPNVAATYDLSMLVEGDGWVFQGLTRRDPTLQVYNGGPEQYTYGEVTLDHFSLGENEQLSLAVGTRSGSMEVAAPSGDMLVSIGPVWEGPTAIDGTIYALQWLKDAASLLPTSYKAFVSKPIALSRVAVATSTLDLAPTLITSGPVSGSVTAKVDGLRNNRAFVQFASGASIMVANEAATADAFSYVVPELTGSSITLMAAVGPYAGPRGVAHKDGLSPSAAGVSLVVPLPPVILTPPDGAKDVDARTSFTFKGSADNTGAFVLTIHRLTSERQKIYVVTTHQALTLPTVVGGALTLSAGQNYEWWVETHGTFASVDEMTSPSGFIDEFGYHGNSPNGGDATEGTYTYSATNAFVAK